MTSEGLCVGGRRVARPTRVEPCAACGGVIGEGYPRCQPCTAGLEALWRADWAALLAEEGIVGEDEERLLAGVVVAEGLRHPWTVVDIAMTLCRCPSCGQELGGGPLACAACESAAGARWAYDVTAAMQGRMTGNEHALRVGRTILRHPHRHSAAIVAAWRLSVPRLLVGWLPTTAEAQRHMALIRAGRLDEGRAMLAALDARLNAGERGATGWG